MGCVSTSCIHEETCATHCEHQVVAGYIESRYSEESKTANDTSIFSFTKIADSLVMWPEWIATDSHSR